jgi:hypothetical protein
MNFTKKEKLLSNFIELVCEYKIIKKITKNGGVVIRE